MPVHLRKLREHSVATALARRVFPVPGAPYSSTPDLRRPGGKSSGWERGSWMVSRMSCFASSRPPTSSHWTLGIWEGLEHSSAIASSLRS